MFKFLPSNRRPEFSFFENYYLNQDFYRDLLDSSKSESEILYKVQKAMIDLESGYNEKHNVMFWDTELNMQFCAAAFKIKPYFENFNKQQSFEDDFDKSFLIGFKKNILTRLFCVLKFSNEIDSIFSPKDEKYKQLKRICIGIKNSLDANKIDPSLNTIAKQVLNLVEVKL